MQNIEAPYSELIQLIKPIKKYLAIIYIIYRLFLLFLYITICQIKPFYQVKNNPINYLKSLTVNGQSVANFNSLKTDYSIRLLETTKSIKVDATKIESSSSIKGTGTIAITEDGQVIPITVTAQNGDELIYNITVDLLLSMKMI